MLPIPPDFGIIHSLPGFKIAVLTNNWIDDSPHRHRTGHAFLLLRRYFDMVFESCRIGLQKPDPKIYEYVLEVMKAKPEEVSSTPSANHLFSEGD